MQITLKFTCRECGRDQELRTDTAGYGVMTMNDEGTVTVEALGAWDLRCRVCGHVSGRVGLGYQYKEEHRPSWERART
jgi:hypothetical protein